MNLSETILSRSLLTRISVRPIKFNDDSFPPKPDLVKTRLPGRGITVVVDRKQKLSFLHGIVFPPADSLMVSSNGRKWLFRGGAVLAGLLPLVVMEVALRLTGIPAPDELYDPWIAFEQVQPLFELDERGARYTISERQLSHLLPGRIHRPGTTLSTSHRV